MDSDGDGVEMITSFDSANNLNCSRISLLVCVFVCVNADKRRSWREIDEFDDCGRWQVWEQFAISSTLIYKKLPFWMKKLFLKKVNKNGKKREKKDRQRVIEIAPVTRVKVGIASKDLRSKFRNNLQMVISRHSVDWSNGDHWIVDQFSMIFQVFAAKSV